MRRAAYPGGCSGWFYVIAGPKASSIDGPCHYTIPPYNRCVVLGPKDPDAAAAAVSRAAGCPAAIVDVNDLGAKVLGVSDRAINKHLLCQILRDNPLGQGHQSTPFGIIRKYCEG